MAQARERSRCLLALGPPFVESATEHRLDDRLAADMEPARLCVELAQHLDGEVDVHALDVRAWERRHHAPFPGEVPRHVFSALGCSRDLLRGGPSATGFLHNSSSLRLSIS